MIPYNSALVPQSGVTYIKTNMNVPTRVGGGLGGAAAISSLLKPVTDAMGNAAVDGAALITGASPQQRQDAANFRAGKPVVKNLDGVSYNVNTPEGKAGYLEASGRGDTSLQPRRRYSAGAPGGAGKFDPSETSERKLTGRAARRGSGLRGRETDLSFLETSKIRGRSGAARNVTETPPTAKPPESTPNTDGSSGGRDKGPPMPGNIPQFGTQMGSRVTIDSMKGFLKDRGISEYLRNPFLSNQLAGTPEHSKALSGTEALTAKVARQANATRGKFTQNNRYFMNAPQTMDGLIEITREQYGRTDSSPEAAQKILDEQTEFGGLVQEQKDKFAGKSVAEVNAAYSAMSDEDKKKYGMAMHAAHFGKFNTPEIKPPAAEQNPVFKTGFDQAVVEGANLPSGLISYNSERPVIMQEQNKTMDPKTLQSTFETKEKPMSQEFLGAYTKKLFG